MPPINDLGTALGTTPALPSADAALAIATWALGSVTATGSELRVDHGELQVLMHGTKAATGRALVGGGVIGADLIRLPAGSGFVPHTHPGHHILIVVGGVGTITYGGRVHRTEPGQVCLVEGETPHAVGAISEHVIIAIGAPHKPIDAHDRMTEVPYTEVIADDGQLACLICDLTAPGARRLHVTGCPHCPCAACVG